jgi:gamma-glutamylcyclotransferase (GGCT)/AIG2-like uncharacterized protein YtfP
MVPIFVYDTLLDKHLVRKIVGRKVDETPDVAVNYKKVHEKGYGWLEYEKGSFVHGAVLELTREEVDKLDSWEDKYKRSPIKLDSGSSAWFYELKDHLKGK